MRADAVEEFTAYVAASAPRMRRTAYLVCGDWQRAEDEVQTALVKLYLAWDRVRARSSLDGFVRTTLVRGLIDERRPLEAGAVAGRLPDRAAVEPMAVEERLTVRDALAQVPPRQRAALVLRFYEDCDVAETARVMGCSEGTVKSQTARGLARLRELLATHEQASADCSEGMKDMPDVTTVLRAAVEEEPPLGFGASDVIARGRAVRGAADGRPCRRGGGRGPVTAAAVIAAAVGASTGGGAVRARTAAYVVSRVEKALAGQHLVLRGRTTTTAGPTISWAYGPRNRFEELTGGGEPYLAAGTALIGGKLTGVYVTYYNREWSLLRRAHTGERVLPDGRARDGRPAGPDQDWSAFIRVTLACGAATVTGHVQIGGQDT